MTFPVGPAALVRREPKLNSTARQRYPKEADHKTGPFSESSLTNTEKSRFQTGQVVTVGADNPTNFATAGNST